MQRNKLTQAKRQEKNRLIQKIIEHDQLGYPPGSRTVFTKRQRESLETLDLQLLKEMLKHAEENNGEIAGQ